MVFAEYGDGNIWFKHTGVTEKGNVNIEVTVTDKNGKTASAHASIEATRLANNIGHAGGTIERLGSSQLQVSFADGSVVFDGTEYEMEIVGNSGLWITPLGNIVPSNGSVKLEVFKDESLSEGLGSATISGSGERFLLSIEDLLTLEKIFLKFSVSS